jgi:hypothetical protein
VNDLPHDSWSGSDADAMAEERAERWRMRYEEEKTISNALQEKLNERNLEIIKLNVKLGKVKTVLSRHPKVCDKHPDDDPVKCGWKSAVADIQEVVGDQ